PTPVLRVLKTVSLGGVLGVIHVVHALGDGLRVRGGALSSHCVVRECLSGEFVGATMLGVFADLFGRQLFRASCGSHTRMKLPGKTPKVQVTYPHVVTQRVTELVGGDTSVPTPDSVTAWNATHHPKLSAPLGGGLG